MSVFDAVKNNRGREDVGIYMAYATYEQRLLEAQQEDRKRILDILAMFHSHDPGLCGEVSSLPDYDPGPCNLFYIISNLISEGMTGDEWWNNMFENTDNPYMAWNEWRENIGIIK